jgi:hypothetical protein
MSATGRKTFPAPSSYMMIINHMNHDEHQIGGAVEAALLADMRKGLSEGVI